MSRQKPYSSNVFERIEQRNVDFWRFLTDKSLTKDERAALVDRVFDQDRCATDAINTKMEDA